jgi:hypothetical protein
MFVLIIFDFFSLSNLEQRVLSLPPVATGKLLFPNRFNVPAA